MRVFEVEIVSSLLTNHGMFNVTTRTEILEYYLDFGHHALSKVVIRVASKCYHNNYLTLSNMIMLCNRTAMHLC